MWPDRRLLELFEIEHPIVLAPMAGFGTVELAAAVANAGGLGSIGCATMNPHFAVETIARLQRLTSKSININFFCHDPAKADADRERAWHDRLCSYYRELGIDRGQRHQRVNLAPFGDAMCEVVEDTRPAVVSFHFGLPAPALLARVKAAGCKVISSATTVEEARWLEQRGVDAVIAQGYEAGGDQGMFLDCNRNRAVALPLGTMALIPQIADRRVPSSIGWLARSVSWPTLFRISHYHWVSRGRCAMRQSRRAVVISHRSGPVRRLH